MKRLKSVFCAALFFCLSVTSLCFAKEETVSNTGFYFDTVITVKLTAENADVLLSGCMDLCQKLEDTFSAQKEGAELLEPTTETVDYHDGTTGEAYAFDIPVPAIGEEFDVAIIGKKGKWYDHRVVVSDPVPVEEAN